MSIIDVYLAHYGYATVAVGVGAESLGLPLPGETILITAATYAGATHRLSPGIVVVVAMVAAIMGDNLGYLIGRRIGARIIGRLDRKLGRQAHHLIAAEALFQRYGSAIVVAGRFVSVVRTYAAILSGSQRMPWRRFLVLNATGAAAWATLVGYGTTALGSNLGQWASYAVTAAVLIGVAFAVASFKRINRRHSRSLPL